MKRWIISAAMIAAFAGSADAQSAARPDSLPLSLEQALARALESSDEVKLAQSQVDVARAQVKDVRAGALPQINANLGYTRTLRSQFESAGEFELPDSMKFEPDSTLSLQERVKYLEDKAPFAGLSGLGLLFSNLPFGQKNAYTASLGGSQLLWSGGRTGAALAVAKNFREAAELTLQEQVADISLQVRSAYFRALLAQELERISDAAVAQAEKFLAQEQLREKTGATSELDVLRAQVALANLRPQAITARNAAEVATLDLKRLINVPASQPLKLTSDLVVPDANRLAQEPPSSVDEQLGRRAAVAAAERQVRMRELGVRIARGAFLPSISVSMNYGRTAFPDQVFKFGGVDWRTDWTAGVAVQVPIFDGLRRNAQLDLAQVQLNQARLQLSQLREGVQIQYQQATGERQRSASAIVARQQTVTQAQRVYDLTVLRYDRGLATQLEVSDARLALLQARTNLAQALSDFYVAEATVARVLGDASAGSR
jgi:outer membrane protein TolC